MIIGLVSIPEPIFALKKSSIYLFSLVFRLLFSYQISHNDIPKEQDLGSTPEYAILWTNEIEIRKVCLI